MDTKLLDVATGKVPADAVIANGKIVNVYTGEIYDGGVAICGNTIAAVGDVDYCIGEGTTVTDAGGARREVKDVLSFRNRIRDGVNEWQDENPAHYN